MPSSNGRSARSACSPSSPSHAAFGCSSRGPGSGRRSWSASWPECRRSSARLILMASHALTEEEAYQTLRRQAMSKRMSLEDMAAAIINAHDLLRARPPS